jgi:hypothetical protein
MLDAMRAGLFGELFDFLCRYGLLRSWYVLTPETVV